MARADTELPKDLKWWVHVSLALMVGLLIFTVGIATAMHLADDQFIGSNELKQTVKELQSFTSEAKLLSQNYHSQSAPRPYVEAYGAQLQEAVDSITEKLAEHPHADSIDDKVSQTIDLSSTLSNQLKELSTEPVTQLPSQSDTNQLFEQLSDQLQNIEEGL